MGCGSSREASGGDEPAIPLQISRPTDVAIHIPRNRVNAAGQPIRQVSRDVDRLGLQQALGLMAQYLHRKGMTVTAVTVGGAVNCLLLQSRSTTHDVDIFGTNLNNQVRMILDEAMQYAIQHSSVPLGTDWLNTETQMWMSPSIQRELTEQALSQNTVVFRTAGLTLVAAPWEYAFCAKIQRLITNNQQIRAYDLDDAVQYLHQIIVRNKGRPILVREIENWARRYNHATNAQYLLNTVNVRYHEVHRAVGIARSR